MINSFTLKRIKKKNRKRKHLKIMRKSTFKGSCNSLYYTKTKSISFPIFTIKFTTVWFDRLGDEAPVPDDTIKPTFTERPVIRQSDDGTKITFECRCVGKPKPTIAW